MKKRVIFALCIFLLSLAQVRPSLGTLNDPESGRLLNGQDVPNGVTYKRASKAVDSKAKSSLELMLKEPTKAPAWFVGNLVTVGPTLWKEIDPTSDNRFGDTGRFMLMIQTSRPFTVQGGVLRTEAAREAFWDALWKLHPELASASVRKAKASELSYYWAMIPYDIAEPFFTLDAGEKQFIVNIIYDKKEISSVWIDLVGDLESLARRIE
jgi:hypothetical protein